MTRTQKWFVVLAVVALSAFALADPPAALNNVLRPGREHEASFPSPSGQNLGGILFGYDASVPYYSNGSAWRSMTGCTNCALLDAGNIFLNDNTFIADSGVRSRMYFAQSGAPLYGDEYDGGIVLSDGGGFGQLRPGFYNILEPVNGVPGIQAKGILELAGAQIEAVNSGCATEAINYVTRTLDANVCNFGVQAAGSGSYKGFRVTQDFSVYMAGNLNFEGTGRVIRGASNQYIELQSQPAVSGVGVYISASGGGLATAGSMLSFYNPGYSGSNVLDVLFNGAIDYQGTNSAGLGPCTASERGRENYNLDNDFMYWCNGTLWQPYATGDGGTSGGGGGFTTANHGVSAASSTNVVCNSAGTLDAGCITLGSQSFAGVKDFIAGVTSSVASGNNAFAVTVNGGRIDFGAGANDYATSDGTNIFFANSSVLVGGVSNWTTSGITFAGGIISHDTTGISAIAGSARADLNQTQNFNAPSSGINLYSSEANSGDIGVRIGISGAQNDVLATQWCQSASPTACTQVAYMQSNGYLASKTPHTLSSVYINAPTVAATTYGGETLPPNFFTLTAVRFRLRAAGTGGSTNATFRASAVLYDAGTMNCDCAFACNSASQSYRVACLSTDAGACIFTPDAGLTYSVNSIGNCAVGPDIQGNVAVEGNWQ